MIPENYIIDHTVQNPGDFEPVSKNYKGKKYRSVIFLDDYSPSQFFEVADKIIKNWKKYQIHTTKHGKEYTSLNVSLKTRRFLVIYHNENTVDKNRIQQHLIDLQRELSNI